MCTCVESSSEYYSPSLWRGLINVYMYMCICMYTCVYGVIVYLHIFVYVMYICIYVHVYMYTCVYGVIVYMYICIYVYIYIFVNMYIGAESSSEYYPRLLWRSRLW